ncbi:MAG: response regulator [Candidatus Thiodiazotropha sp.]
MSEFRFKGAGIEASAKIAQAEATAVLAAASAAKYESAATSEIKIREARAAAHIVNEYVTPTAIQRASKSRALWVDDHPSNNILERQSLETLGMNFVTSKSTEDALAQLEIDKYDLIISDMGRPPDDHAGYTLLDQLRKIGDKTPLIIYSGSRAPKHRAEAKKRGAIDCTNKPDELFGLVIKTLDKTA